MTNKAPMINEALRLVRLYWGLSQVELSEKIDVSQSMISEIESGKKAPTLEILEKYSKGLKIRKSQLIFFAEEIEGEPVERRGKLIVAEKVLHLLDRLKPNEPTTA